MSMLDKILDFGRYSATPAGIIDQYYLQEGTGWVSRLSTFIKIRATYLLLFLPAVAIDLIFSSIAAFFSGLGVLLTTDQQQVTFGIRAQDYSTLVTKNLYALLASPFGLLSPKLVAFYFIAAKNSSNGVLAGGHYHHADHAVVQSPDSIEEVQAMIKAAAHAGKKIIPRGAGFSQGKQFLPAGEEGIVLDLHELNTIAIDPSNKTVKVGAGARWLDIQLEINKHKLALKVMQASNVFSVGGSIGTNIHGWDHQTGVLSNTILSMEVINAAGERLTINSENPLFHHITGGLGLYGVVVSVTLKLADNVFLKETSTIIPPKDYAGYFIGTVLDDDTHKMHLYRLSLDPSNLLGEGVAVSYVSQANTIPQKTPDLLMEASQGTRFQRVMINLSRRFDSVRRLYWRGERERLLSNTSEAQTTNQIMQPAINAMFNSSASEAEWLQEYFLPGEQLDFFLKGLGKILMENGVPVLNASVRYVKQHDASPFSYAKREGRFAVVLCFNQSLCASEVIQAKKWIRQAQHLAVEQSGTYYLPYQQVSSQDDFSRSYSDAPQAELFKKTVDPHQLFTSGFHQKYMASDVHKPNYFKLLMSNAAMKQEFQGFLTNVLQRVDCEPFYQLLEDVMSYNDTHEEIYEELCARLPEIMPSTLLDISHVLTSLSAIKGDLGAQASALLPATVQKIDGLVEIGYPGRFVHGFKERYKVSGTIVAVCEKESPTDYLQTGYPRPYGKFQALDYKSPNLLQLADNTAEVITCYVGLHHFSSSSLGCFLDDVSRVLKQGGHFLLVDHDVVDEKTMTMAHMAHSVFNAVNGASLHEEITEHRDFKSMAKWQEILNTHGLTDTSSLVEGEFIRKGDPSRNRMMHFSKPHAHSFFDSPGEMKHPESRGKTPDVVGYI